MAFAPTSVVQASSEYSFTAPASVPPTLHFTVLSVALSGLTVAVMETVPPTSIVCAVDGLRVTPVTATASATASGIVMLASAVGVPETVTAVSLVLVAVIPLFVMLANSVK